MAEDKQNPLTNSDDWLKQYHSRLQSEYELSMKKKDTLTNWSLTILLATIGLYFGQFVGITNFESESRFALVIGTLIIQIQFFVNSMLAYGFLKKWRYLKERIEKYWAGDDIKMEDIKNEITGIDHGRRMKTSWKDMIWAQLRAGFLLILSAPILLAVSEIYRASVITNYHYLVLGALVAFLIWQVLISINYDQFKKVKPEEDEETTETEESTK